MTVCIAAKAVEREKAFIVLCMDSMVSPEYTSSQSGWKIATLSRGFTALIAGDISQANEMSGIYRQLFYEREITNETVRDVLRDGLRKFKRNLADQYLGSQLGLSYEDFTEKGRARFPDRSYERILGEIQKLPWTGELIIAGFIDGRAAIFKLGSWGVWSGDDFVAIGMGVTLAEASLFNRDYTFNTGLSEAFYRVYEAKRLSEKALGVGEKTYMAAVEVDALQCVTINILSSAGIRSLSEDYERFGPQRIQGVKEIAAHLTPIPYWANSAMSSSKDQT